MCFSLGIQRWKGCRLKGDPNIIYSNIHEPCNTMHVYYAFFFFFFSKRVLEYLLVRRLRLEADSHSAQRSMGMRWELLARGELLKLILAYLQTPSYLKLLAASKQVQEDFVKHWSEELDLTNLSSRGGLQSFHKFLALPRWKAAKILRMPKDGKLGLFCRWPKNSMSHVTTCLPNLQELDLLSFGLHVKWPEDDSARAHFAQSFANLFTLKLALAEYQQADMLASLSNLRVLHLGCLACIVA